MRKGYVVTTLSVGVLCGMCAFLYMSNMSRCSTTRTIISPTATPHVIDEDKEFNRLEMKFDGLTRQPDLRIELRPNMTLNDTDILFYQSVSYKHYVCKDWVRMGKLDDGGWSVCIARPYRLQKPCLVYSFGINNDWSFDDAVSKTYGCLVRAFDPSMMQVSNHTRGKDIYFYKIGFGGSDRLDQRNWTIRTLSTLVQHFHDDDKIIDYLKFDIEYSEWEVLESFVTNPINEWLLKHHVKQLAFEIHTEWVVPKQSPSVDLLYKRWMTLGPLESRLGFRRWWFSVNPVSQYFHAGRRRSLAYEMVYINRRFLLPPVEQIR